MCGSERGMEDDDEGNPGVLSKAEVAQLFSIAGQIIENFKVLRATEAPRGRIRKMARAAE